MIGNKFYLLALALFLLFAVPAMAQSAKKLVKTADRHFEAKQYRDAFEKYNQARQQDSKMYEAYLGMGKSLLLMDREQEAFAELQRAAAFGAKEWEPYFYLGKIYFQRGEWSDAIEKLAKAAELDRKNEEVLQVLFRAQIQFQKPEAALVTAKNLVKRNEKDAYNQYLLGVVLDTLKQYPEAEEQYLSARFADPTLAKAYLGAAHVRMQMGALDKALEDCNKAIEKNRQSPDAYLMRSKVRLAQKDFQGAINDLSAVLDLDPETTKAQRLRAKTYSAFGQHQNAIDDWSAILTNDPDDVQALYHRAETYERINDLSRAAIDYERLLEISPDDERAAQLLAEATERSFEMNRETGLPDVNLTSHSVDEYYRIDIPENLDVAILTGNISDQSRIAEFKINDQQVSFAVDSLNPTFRYELPLNEDQEVRFEVSDIYHNTKNIIYKIRRTETHPPEVQLLAPYAGDDGVMMISGNIYDIRVEGRIFDASNIRQIQVNGVNASFSPDRLNPRFSADVRIANQSHLTILAHDFFGNTTEKKYEIDRNGASLLTQNPMGRTWGIFIENSDYSSFASIDGPTKDVNLMKQALENYYFDNVIHKKNMTKTEMERFFSIDLRDLVRSNEVNSLMIWFAGHGKYLNETGYWIPVDASRDDEFSFFNINALKTGVMTYSDELVHTLVVTDACESGSSFADVTRDEFPERRCDDWEAARMRSSQVFSSAGYELASDHSQFTRTFANMLGNNPDACLPIESVVVKVTEVVKKEGKQSPKFGVIDGLGDENGTFFFMRKSD